MNRFTHILYIIAFLVALTSCGSSKHAVSTETSSGTVAMSQNDIKFIQRVYDNEVYVKNIVANLDFTLSAGGKNITVGGTLHMKRDDVIRIQLIDPILGVVEIGRLEFTKDYVLIQDRIHKQFAKTAYDKVSFLNSNGLDFYTIQALMWNNLYVPGTERVTESLLGEFSLLPQESEGKNQILLKRGQFTYLWDADKKTAQIENVAVAYNSKSYGNTNVNCKYADFVPMGKKQFPSNILLSMQTTAIKGGKSLALGFKLNNINNSDKWETRTTPSSKYKEISVEELLENLMNLQ